MLCHKEYSILYSRDLNSASYWLKEYKNSIIKEVTTQGLWLVIDKYLPEMMAILIMKLQERRPMNFIFSLDIAMPYFFKPKSTSFASCII